MIDTSKPCLIISFQFPPLLGQVSFTQERIFLDEKIRFASKGNRMYAVPLVYRISSGSKSLSISRLHRALHAVVLKHPILRTALLVDKNGMVIQSLIALDSSEGSDQQSFGFAVLDEVENESKTIETIYNSDLFDLTTGRVLYCHIIRRRPSSFQNVDLVVDKDIILFSIHHSAFDGASISIFLRDLSLAYLGDRPLPIDGNALQYIDYSTHERQLDMTTSHDFWRAQLDGYDLERGLVLPFDRHRLSTNERSGRPCIVDFTLSEQLTRSFLAYASSQSVTPFQLGLAVFYAFLFKLSNGQQDLCIASINANRYRAELRDIIGMFVATLPYRIQLDSSATFKQLVGQVRDLCLSVLEHSHYPLQRIIGSQHTPAFLETMFDFITVTPDIERVDLDGAVLEPVSSEKVDHVAKFDMMLTFVHNPSTGMSFSLICSQDLFDQSTVQTLADRFSCLLHRLFDSTAMTVTEQSLCQLSIILPKEEPLIHSLKHNGINRLQAPYSTINELFNQQAFSQPQKLSVELDEQSLTYSELFFYAQQLALLLIDGHDVKAGDIVCQCVERSLSMVRLMRTTSLL